jgi:protein phosphatase
VYHKAVLNKIVIPEKTLVVLCGIAGCGKSTFAAKHFRLTQIVSSDTCRAMVCDDETNQQVSGQAFELWRFIIRKRLSFDRLTVADATNLDRGDRSWLTGVARYYRYYSVAVVFNIPLEICLARNASRHRVVPEEALIRQAHLLDQTNRSIQSESFNRVYFLNEEEQPEVEIQVAPINK